MGVPQGSCLGPLFFLIHINDIFSSTPHDQLLLYADDAVLMNYIVEAWGGTYDSHLKKLNVTHNKIVRTLAAASGIHHLSTSEMYRRLGLLKIKDIYRP